MKSSFASTAIKLREFYRRGDIMAIHSGLSYINAPRPHDPRLINILRDLGVVFYKTDPKHDSFGTSQIEFEMAYPFADMCALGLMSLSKLNFWTWPHDPVLCSSYGTANRAFTIETYADEHLHGKEAGQVLNFRDNVLNLEREGFITVLDWQNLNVGKGRENLKIKCQIFVNKEVFVASSWTQDAEAR